MLSCLKFRTKGWIFLFGAMLSEMVLRHTDNLSRTLQKKTRSAAEGQQIARLVVDALLTVRNNESFDLFWQKLKFFSQPLDKPRLPRDLNYVKCVLMKLVLIMSATNASSEHSFSALRRIQNYLNNTMG